MRERLRAWWRMLTTDQTEAKITELVEWAADNGKTEALRALVEQLQQNPGLLKQWIAEDRKRDAA